MFVKTFKTGGTTLQNILMRHGDVNNLVFVLFKSSDSLDHKIPFPAHKTPKLIEGKNYNILCRHSMYKRTAMASIMPKDTVYITLIRDPVKHFISAFWYYGYPQAFGIAKQKHPMGFFVDNLDNPNFKYKFPFNGVLSQLGLHKSVFKDDQKLQHSLKQLDKEFELVLITEYFEESLILLKRLLNWRLDEMVYFKMRVQTNQSEMKLLTPNQQKVIREKRHPVVLLYDYFNKTLWRKISEQDDTFWDEVRQLRNMIQETTTACVGEGAKSLGAWGGSGAYYKTRNDSAVDTALCNRLVVAPIPYTVHLAKKQLPFLADQSIAMFYKFVPRLYWGYSSWSPTSGFFNESRVDRVCKDSAEERTECLKSLGIPVESIST